MQIGRTALLGFAALSLLLPVVAFADDVPIPILSKLQAAYEQLDAELYASLLAPDYEFRYGEGEKAMTWDRDKELTGIRELFEKAASISVSFDDGVEVRRDPAGAWVIHTRIGLKVNYPNGDSVDVSSPHPQRLVVRDDDAAGFVISAWHDVPAESDGP